MRKKIFKAMGNGEWTLNNLLHYQEQAAYDERIEIEHYEADLQMEVSSNEPNANG
jgi:hypothetical protein